MNTRARLSIMMFLEYAIWGAWFSVLSVYLSDVLGFSGTQVGFIYSLLPLATIISPFIGGQIADRYFSTEKVIAFTQLLGGVILIVLSQIESYNLFWVLLFVYCLLYAPTLALTNSISMINLKDPETEFGQIRVFGTIGWIAAGWVLTAWRRLAMNTDTLALQGDLLMLAGFFSLIMGLQALTLPHTPPQKEAKNPFAFLEAFKMLKNPSFLAFIIISFVVATELQFYYVLTAPFLKSPIIGIADSDIPLVMTIAQAAEIIVMAFLLPIFVKKYGIRNTMIFGILAWPIRYIIFAVGAPTWLVIASLTLHGFCYVFFFVVAFIYVDKVAPPDIRASAQSMINLVILGVGMFLGSNFAGWIKTIFTEGAVTNWRNVFLVPVGITVACAIAFLLFFRDRPSEREQPIET